MPRILSSGTWRALACALLLSLAPLHAQDDGFNFHVLSNAGQLIYFGLGAGSGSTPGVDVVGYWVGGEDLQGATLTGLGEFGYKQAGMRLSACVFNLGSNSRLDFPLVLTVELDDSSTSDGFNFHHPFNFLRPGCGVGSANPGVAPVTTAIFGAALGTPPGSTFAFITAGLPTGLGAQLPTAAVLLTPNAGLIPSSGGIGTLTLVSAVSVTAAISAAGCFNLDLDWTATLGSSIPALDDVGGWWTQLNASRDNNQYWMLTNSNLSLLRSKTVFTSSGATAVASPVASTGLELHYFSLDPVTHAAIAPTGTNADTAYYASGNPGAINSGFDLGPAGAISSSALNGAHTLFSGDGTLLPPPGINPQDVANAALNIGPTPTGGAVTNTLGFVTWNNNTPTIPHGPGGAGRLTWVQADLDLLAGGAADPSSQTSVELFFGSVRVPIRVPTLATSWPSSVTTSFWPLFLHSTVDETGNSQWPDPSGNAAGALGVKPVVGQSIHVPIFGGTGACAFNGLPIGLIYGTSGLANPWSGPLEWDPQQNRVSSGRSILIYD